MPYIGRDLNRGNYLKLDDISSSFNSSTRTFNLTVGGSAFTPGSAFSILVSVGGVIQEPESAYQVNNSEITFANAPTAQDSFFCIALAAPIGIGVPGNGTVNGTQMAKPFNYDGFFFLNNTSNRVGINSSIPTAALDVDGVIKASSFTGGSGGINAGVVTCTGLDVNGNGDISGNLVLGGDLTVNGTTTTLDTNLIGVDRIEVGANSSTVVGVAVTQSGTADLVRLYDGASQVVTVDDTGNIGIGSAIPSTKLDVNGTSKFQDNVSFTTANGNGIIISKSSNYMMFGNSVTQYFGGSSMWLMHNGSTGYLHNVTGDLYIRNEDSSGDIYIQGKSGEHSIICNYDGAVQLYHDSYVRLTTTSTGVQIANGSADINLRSSTSSATGQGQLTFENVDGNGQPRDVVKIIGASHGNGGYGELRLQTAFNNTLSTRLTITETGRVGIGTNLPLAGLHISDGTAYGTPQITNQKAQLVISAGTETSANIQLLANSYNHIFFGTSSDANAGSIVYTHTGGYTNNMTFGVGAGNLNLTHRGTLQIKSSMAAGNSFLQDFTIKDSNNNAQWQIGMYTNSSEHLYINNNAEGNIVFAHAAPNHVTFASDGKVGIGTNLTAPSYKLDVREAHNAPYSASGTSAQLAIGNINSSTNTNSSGIHMYSDGNGRGVVNLNCLSTATSSSADFTIQTRHSGTLGEKLRITSTGEVKIPTGSNTTSRLTFGGGINIYHDGNMKFENISGYLKLSSANNLYIDGAELFFRNAGGTNRWKIDSSGHLLPGAVGTYNIGSTGAEIGNVYLADSKNIYIGSDQDVYFNHSGVHAQIKNTTGNFYFDTELAHYIRLGSNNEAAITATHNSSVDLYYDGGTYTTPKLKTSATGITVDGEVAASQDYPDLKPTLDLNFAATAKLDTRVTFTREGSGTYYGKDGLVKFASTNEPRFDHDPVTRECRGLLIEEQRRNQFRYTTRPGDSGWDGSKSGTFVQNTTETAAPDGTFTATKWTFTNTDPYLYDVQNLDANDPYTISMWVKAGTNMAGDRVQMRIGGSPYSSGDIEVIPADGTWRRISYTRTIGGSAENSASVGFEPQTSPSGNPASGDVIYIWGPQFEKGEFVSSYIPSHSNYEAIRGADKCYIDGQDFDDFYNQPEGTIVSSHSLLENVSTTSNCYTYQVAPDSGTSEAPFRLIDRNSSYGNTLVATSINSNANVCFFKASGDPATVANVKMKVAFAIKKDDFAASFNGGATLTDTSGNVSETNDHLAIGYYKPSPQAYLNGHIQRLAYYPKRLPNNQLRTLSS